MEQTLPTPEAVAKLLDNLEYMQHEARAMKNVIGDIPHREQPSGDQLSIGQYLTIIDQLQAEGALLLAYQVQRAEEELEMQAPGTLEQTFQERVLEREQAASVMDLLEKVADNRKELMEVLPAADHADWAKQVEKSNLTLYHWFDEMLQTERKLLKSMGRLVMVYAQQREAMREVETKRKQRERWNSSSAADDDSEQ